MHTSISSLISYHHCFCFYSVNRILCFLNLSKVLDGVIMTLFLDSKVAVYRGIHRRYSVKKGVLRNFAKFTGKHLCQILFSDKKETLAQVFTCEYCEISKNTFSIEHSQTTASEYSWQSSPTTPTSSIFSFNFKHQGYCFTIFGQFATAFHFF